MTFFDAQVNGGQGPQCLDSLVCYLELKKLSLGFQVSLDSLLSLGCENDQCVLGMPGECAAPSDSSSLQLWMG